RHVLPNLLLAIASAVCLPAEGCDPGPLPGKSGACPADVSAAVFRNDGKQSGGSEMSRESRIEIWRDALRAAARGKHLWLVQFFGAAALLASAYGWLWIPESNARELLGSAFLALLLAALALWLRSEERRGGNERRARSSL